MRVRSQGQRSFPPYKSLWPTFLSSTPHVFLISFTLTLKYYTAVRTPFITSHIISFIQTFADTSSICLGVGDIWLSRQASQLCRRNYCWHWLLVCFHPPRGFITQPPSLSPRGHLCSIVARYRVEEKLRSNDRSRHDRQGHWLAIVSSDMIKALWEDFWRSQVSSRFFQRSMYSHIRMTTMWRPFKGSKHLVIHSSCLTTCDTSDARAIPHTDI